MSLRDLFQNRAKGGGVDEHAANPGADNPAENTGGAAAHLSAAARANALDLADKSPRRKRTGASARAVENDQRVLQDRIDAEIGRQLEAVHDPKAWGALLAAPGDVAVALTGREFWEISKDERETLGATGSAAARTMMITNPKALAFLMLGCAMFSVYVPRMMKEANHMRMERAAAKKKDEPAKA